MSSAILYLAIIAIWACVLIPRWLKRDLARGAATMEATAEDQPAGLGLRPEDGLLPADGEPGGLDLDGSQRGEDGLDGSGLNADGVGDPVPVPFPGGGGREPEAASEDAGAPAPGPASRAEARRRVLASRRRLLWMMTGLEAAGAVLGVSGLAAWWVIAPPTVMLAAYLVLLREAAQADKERDARERDAQEAAAVSTRERARPAREARPPAPAASSAARQSATQPSVTQPPAIQPAGIQLPPVAYAAAPVPEDHADPGPGRDFTPGQRYAGDGAADDEAYDQYTEDRLRAVGD
ncbi:MAG TPA: hypothetical protein VH478_19725 [Trebonia sp.]|jgi:hypothetical protein|nr:hypothetical protein [Trebonia sp.]